MIRDHISFFTRLPTGKMGDFEKIANTQYLFPVIGVLIGFLMYGAASLIYISPLTPKVGSVLLILFLYLLTGILHLDGISDLADGLVMSGSRDEKVEAMMDPELGVAGALSALLVLLILFAEFEAVLTLKLGVSPLFQQLELMIPYYSIFVPLVASEIIAKFSMNTAVMFSDPIEESSAGLFIRSLNRKSYLASFTFSSVALTVLNPVLVLVMVVSQLIPLYLIRVSRENFGGGNGDMVGSSNELSRAFALLVIFFI